MRTAINTVIEPAIVFHGPRTGWIDVFEVIMYQGETSRSITETSLPLSIVASSNTRGELIVN